MFRNEFDWVTPPGAVGTDPVVEEVAAFDAFTAEDGRVGDVANAPGVAVALTTLLLLLPLLVTTQVGVRSVEEGPAPVVGTGTATTVLMMPESWAEEEEVVLLEEAAVT